MCVFFTLSRFLSTRRHHPAHPVTVLILHPREISAVGHTLDNSYFKTILFAVDFGGCVLLELSGQLVLETVYLEELFRQLIAAIVY